MKLIFLLEKYIDEHSPDISSVFFLMVKTVMLKTIESRSDYVLYQTELEINMPIKTTTTYNLLGKIDKIMKHQLFEEKVYIVDYKTGNAVKPLDYIFDGINSQLLFYLLFLKKKPFSKSLLFRIFLSKYIHKCFKS